MGGVGSAITVDGESDSCDLNNIAPPLEFSGKQDVLSELKQVEVGSEVSRIEHVDMSPQ